MEINIRIAGAAGQGVQTAADLLGKAITRSGRCATSYSDAESRIRGGLNFTHLRAADECRLGVVDDYDILVALSDLAVSEFGGKIAEKGALICQKECDHPRRAPFALEQLARKSGSEQTVNTVATAGVGALLGIDREVLDGIIQERFAGKAALREANARAVELGYRAAWNWKPGERFRLGSNSSPAKRLWVAGHEAISLGAVAGGVRFLAGYPMSPATSILTDLASWAEEAGLVVEQAEDEIAAINLVAGASYAGARAMTATSGGGFCLMVEGVSLLGMIEAPAVIVLGQRPGPATGLPTRTAQGDLHLVLHAGHGFFPRVILAPKNVSDGFEITARAFDLAERFQVPVFVLTDQLLQDSQASIEAFSVEDLPRQRYFLDGAQLASLKNYQRYAQTDSGVSPLAAPGSSPHVVVVDSDEHDEDGHLTELAQVADRMARKRLRKAKTLQEAMLLPPAEVEGELEGRPLVVSWGSSYETLAEARSALSRSGREFAHLHLRQLWPLQEERLSSLFSRASSVTVVENSVDVGLAALLRRVTLRPVDRVINRMDGRPFHLAELVQRLQPEVSR